MKAVIVGYLRGHNRQYVNQVLVKPLELDDPRLAPQLIGRKIVYRDKYGNTYVGKVVDTHGRKGLVIARFRRNLPGQAIGELAELL